MAPDTDLTAAETSGAFLRWMGRLSLTARILAVNILPLALLAGSFFYLDGFRARLIEERELQAAQEAKLVADGIGREDLKSLPKLVSHMGAGDKVRIRIVDAAGMILADNWAGQAPTFTLKDPEQEGWQRQFARGLDEGIDWLVSAEVPPAYVDHTRSMPNAPEGAKLSLAPDRTHMIEARATVTASPDLSVVTLRNARDIRRFVRAERASLGQMLGITAFFSILMSLFLARTIVKPLRLLADAAREVRFGQAREVQVPRLPFRDDDIGRLARAISDMTHSLRTRMDGIEAFAADVAHEIKNPLASLASATQSLKSVKKPDLRTQLEGIIADDIRRLDRLITDISDFSRVDAHISWARFQKVDLGSLVGGLIKARLNRKRDEDVSIAFARPLPGTAVVMADPGQLERVIDNLLDNAVSFSPVGGKVRVAATRSGTQVILSVDDDGPGVPPASRETIFDRFHSDRPEAEFGKHSGLGLSIARTIIEAHSGTISVSERETGESGASFIIRIAAANI